MSGILQILLGISEITTPIVVSGFAYVPADSTTITLTKPTDTTENDLMIACVYGLSNINAIWTGDTGWTELYDVGDRLLYNCRVAYKIATASEPANYTFTATQTLLPPMGIIVSLRNAVIDVCGDTDSASDHILNGITVTENNSILLAFMRTYNTTNPSIPSITNFTTITTAVDTSNRVSLLKSSVNSGATGDITATVATGSGQGILVSVKQT